LKKINDFIYIVAITNRPMTLNEIKKTEEFYSFFAAAYNYCSLIEKSHHYTEKKFLSDIRKHLLEIYSRALEIPKIEIIYSEVFDPIVDVKSQLNKLNNLVEGKLYWTPQEPMSLNNYLIERGDIVSDLITIYRHLKKSILLFKTNNKNAQIDAIWQFKFDFQTHWEKRCVNALFAIQSELQ